MWSKVVQRLLDNQTVLLANRVAPIVNAVFLAGFVVSSFNGKKVTEAEPKYVLTPFQQWRASLVGGG